MNEEALRQKIDDAENGLYAQDISLILDIIASAIRWEIDAPSDDPQRMTRLRSLKRKFGRLAAEIGSDEQ